MTQKILISCLNPQFALWDCLLHSKKPDLQAGKCAWSLTNDFRDELADQVPQVTGSSLSGHELDHLLTNLPDLTALGVAGALDLLVTSTGETDAEHAEHIAVGRLDVSVGLNQGLPLPHEGAQLVCGEVHALHQNKTE